MAFAIDVDEKKWSRKIINELLVDRSTNGNIIWATDDYVEYGKFYKPQDFIIYECITGFNDEIIQPRVLKSKKKRGKRVKSSAEVFTPSWICNLQNNLIDKEWFGRDIVFNIELNNSWQETKEKILFPNNSSKSWKKYVDEKRLEVTCGEAPYLVSRYDTVSGDPIPLTKRIGLLDRKIRVIGENTHSEQEWLKWVERAFQSIYGFEFQGDNLLIARENLLISFCDYMMDKFGRYPKESELLRIARIISWNLWQMDGSNYCPSFNSQSLCKIKDWRSKKIITFKDLIS